MKREEFLEKMRNVVERVLEVHPWIPKSAVVAQIILETGWGKSRLYQEGKNLFGIKAFGKISSDGVLEFWTKEWDGKRWVEKVQRFRKYRLEEECLTDYVRILSEGRAYWRVREARSEEEFIREMARLWATDPNYAQKWLKVLQSIQQGVRK